MKHETVSRMLTRLEREGFHDSMTDFERRTKWRVRLALWTAKRFCGIL